jgi:hypothetical protein
MIRLRWPKLALKFFGRKFFARRCRLIRAAAPRRAASGRCIALRGAAFFAVRRLYRIRARRRIANLIAASIKAHGRARRRRRRSFGARCN